MATMEKAIIARLSDNRSTNSQMLKMIRASGWTKARSGWDTLNGPTWRADWLSSEPDMTAATRAYTGQSMSIPLIPDVVSVSVAVLTNVAVSAHASPAAAASRAVRRTGGPRVPRTANRAMTPPNTSNADFSHCRRLWAGMAAGRLSRPEERRQCPADDQCRGPRGPRATSWRIHNRRSTRTKTSSVTRIGWTSDSWPKWRAAAWNANAPAAAIQPSSHTAAGTGNGPGASPSPALARRRSLNDASAG